MHIVPGFKDKLIQWYQLNKRDLPWRNTLDPFKIWISEIILQQTRVNQGMPYYHRFIASFSSVKALADAPLDGILRLWQGLGYYSRARNMHIAAKQIVNDYNAVFPASFAELLKLRGVGRYTAAAIASFAFNESVPVVDGNVLRVFTRICGIEDDISLPATVRKIEVIAAGHIPSDSPGLFNQAIMEFGAMYCTPYKPDCPNCIFKTVCQAYKLDLVSVLPVKINKVKVKQRFFHYIVFKHSGEVAMRQRFAKDIWTGLFEYYLVEDKELLESEFLRIQLSKLVREEVIFTSISDTYVHILSHQKLFARFYECEIKNKSELVNAGFQFYNSDQIEHLAKPVLIIKYLNKEKLI